MGFNCFLDRYFNFFPGFTHRNTTRQIWHKGTENPGSLLDYHQIFQLLHGDCQA